MVITAALSWFLTRTPPSCETVAAAIALTLASRTIPSSCLSLISLSPHPGGHPHRSCAALLGAFSYNIQPLRKSVDLQRLTTFTWVRPDCSCNFYCFYFCSPLTSWGQASSPLPG